MSKRVKDGPHKKQSAAEGAKPEVELTSQCPTENSNSSNNFDALFQTLWQVEVVARLILHQQKL
ncbi:hypothetical protein OUZ56_033677 [Daphnia magna]|uniref:Uncharacterized protein n=1 Tax=Daphnia magna TaxID=35525 RepID=A0ABQ9ZYE1_9CRUS|nr:hypothetical protein OUZ56_011962 [Daphnia magna]KAK4017831.1 hypothetical protein OUZ56_033677 [Daphnia magna]